MYISPKHFKEAAEKAVRELAQAREEIEQWRNATARKDPDDCRVGIKQLYDHWQQAEARAEANAKDAERLRTAAKALRDAGVKVGQDLITPPYAGDTVSLSAFIGIFDGPLQRELDAAIAASAKETKA